MLVMLMLMIKKMQAIYWEMFFQLRRQNLVFGRRVHYFIAAQGFLSTIGHEQIFFVCVCVFFFRARAKLAPTGLCRCPATT